MERRIYYPRTTSSQRRRLFEIWEETGNLRDALKESRVSEGTFYRWKPRFEKGGYPALEKFDSHAPNNPRRTAEALEVKVIELRRRNPKWGKRRIADEMAKANNWVALISPNTVKRILKDAGLWTTEQPPVKKGDP